MQGFDVSASCNALLKACDCIAILFEVEGDTGVTLKISVKGHNRLLVLSDQTDGPFSSQIVRKVPF